MLPPLKHAASLQQQPAAALELAALVATARRDVSPQPLAASALPRPASTDLPLLKIEERMLPSC